MSLEQDSTPDFKDSVNRVLEEAFFPTSPAATLRESIFSEILAGVLGASPSTEDLDELREAMEAHEAVPDEATAEQIWEVFEASYTTTGERGARGKKAKRYVLPFHPSIAKAIKPKETRNWGKWYRMLMTETDPVALNTSLHDSFVTRLEEMEASNLFEQIFIDAAHELQPGTASQQADPDPIKPYVASCATRFQEDLRVWLDDEYDSPTNWLQSTKDLFCFHFMMYYLQLSINLRAEFQAAADGELETFEPRIREIYFGLWDERATHDRRFSKEWRERDDQGLERFVYDSWGRLAALRLINDAIPESQTSAEQPVYTLSEAVEELSETQQQQCAAEIATFANFEDSGTMDLPTAAVRLVHAVRRYYESRSKSNQTPISMGVNVIRQLGEGQDRRYYRTQRKVGPTLRLNRSALRFFARLFASGQDDKHYEQFLDYLRQRGIYLDSQSQNVALEELDEMGLIDRQSDSGGSVYVRAI
ncbi:DNA phosphorothioation-dependent restriction protein DptG [Haloglomus litoreum]|uniref:DNA phosphorothioation-dependent restriction protein DptG n=1 Tax=Haloglomus litoreum TaxID=3034026 RepID=UPI0023E76EAF|nr:DNA phosphorothioation-dependent restriction protein DptG [Haloglomus sp. DT116]